MRMGLSKRRFKIKGIIVIPIIIVFIVYFVAERLKPAFISVAHERANCVVVDIINQNIANVFKKYDTAGFYIRNGDAIINDVSNINMLKSEIMNSIMSSLKTNNDTIVKIPLGSASGVYLLNGIGPDISIKVAPSRIVKSDFEDSFDDAGINFVKHTIYLNISVLVNYRGFIMDENETIVTRVPIIENIMSGDVPDYYGENIGVMGN